MPSENNIVTVEDNNLPVMAQPHMRLIEIAVERGADIHQLEKLMDLQERYEANQAKKAFDIAMSEFQSVLPVIEKKGTVDFESAKGRTYYKYAKIDDIATAIQPALKASGLSYRFKQTQDQTVVTVTCIIAHKGGHQEESTLESVRDTSGGKDALKGLASTLTYLRRYALCGALGIVAGDEDLDGEPTEPEVQKLCYPDEEFKKNFPIWAKSIASGKKTPEQMLAFLQSKNVIISQAQYDQLQQVEVK